MRRASRGGMGRGGRGGGGRGGAGRGATPVKKAEPKPAAAPKSPAAATAKPATPSPAAAKPAATPAKPATPAAKPAAKPATPAAKPAAAATKPEPKKEEVTNGNGEVAATTNAATKETPKKDAAKKNFTGRFFVPSFIEMKNERHKHQAAREVYVGPATLGDLSNEQLYEHIQRSNRFIVQFNKSKEDGEFKGCLQLIFNSVDEAKNCTKELTELKIREGLDVRHAYPEGDKLVDTYDIRSHGNPGLKYKEKVADRTLILIDINETLTEEEIAAAIPKAVDVCIPHSYISNERKRHAYVELPTSKDVEELAGKPIQIGEVKIKTNRPEAIPAIKVLQARIDKEDLTSPLLAPLSEAKKETLRSLLRTCNHYCDTDYTDALKKSDLSKKAKAIKNRLTVDSRKFGGKQGAAARKAAAQTVTKIGEKRKMPATGFAAKRGRFGATPLRGGVRGAMRGAVRGGVRGARLGMGTGFGGRMGGTMGTGRPSGLMGGPGGVGGRGGFGAGSGPMNSMRSPGRSAPRNDSNFGMRSDAGPPMGGGMSEPSRFDYGSRNMGGINRMDDGPIGGGRMGGGRLDDGPMMDRGGMMRGGVGGGNMGGRDDGYYNDGPSGPGGYSNQRGPNQASTAVNLLMGLSTILKKQDGRDSMGGSGGGGGGGYGSQYSDNRGGADNYSYSGGQGDGYRSSGAGQDFGGGSSYRNDSMGGDYNSRQDGYRSGGTGGGYGSSSYSEPVGSSSYSGMASSTNYSQTANRYSDNRGGYGTGGGYQDNQGGYQNNQGSSYNSSYPDTSRGFDNYSRPNDRFASSGSRW